jgi:hypothetical protein
MKKPVVISVVVLLSLIVAACSSPTTSSPTPAANSASAAVANAAPAGEDLTQTNNEAMVTVAVTPLNLNDKSAAALDFKIALNTHSVDPVTISYDRY